jgi:hypothetical protein
MLIVEGEGYMTRLTRAQCVLAAAAVVLLGIAPEKVRGAGFPIAKIFWEFNSTANDLGVHVFLDAEDWRTVEIVHPNGQTVFSVNGGGGFGQLGMTELFFEGAEPSLDDFPLEDLLGLFPEGRYTFIGEKVDGRRLTSRPTLSHAIPAGPVVDSQVNGNSVIISWDPVSVSAPGFPAKPIVIVGYQVLVDPFQVTLPASATSVTLPVEFVESLASGDHPFEVLAIEASGNQTITEGSFNIP